MAKGATTRQGEPKFKGFLGRFSWRESMVLQHGYDLIHVKVNDIDSLFMSKQRFNFVKKNIGNNMKPEKKIESHRLTLANNINWSWGK